jgi:DNA-directed RNA polymerase specialized sigma24 family protein
MTSSSVSSAKVINQPKSWLFRSLHARSISQHRQPMGARENGVESGQGTL